MLFYSLTFSWSLIIKKKITITMTKKMAISLSPKVPKLLDINTSNIISK